MPATHPPFTTEATLRREQVRALGTTFLRRRPWVAAPTAALNALLLHGSGAPLPQRAAVGATMAALLGFFCLEAWYLRRRQVDERWFLSSLVATTLVIAGGAAVTGGATSPLLPLLFAPVGVGFAAFGGSAAALVWLGWSLLALALALVLPWVAPTPSVAAPYSTAMALVSAIASLVLLYLGVAGMTGAHARAAERLDRLRRGVLEEARARAEETESVGAKLAHELKNPLSSIKGLVQLLAKPPQQARAEKRFAVLLSEIDRLERTLEDYLSFARPLRDVALGALRLDRWLADLASLIEPHAAAQRTRVVLRVEPVTALADDLRLRDAVLNLTNNALAAMPEGGTLELHAGRQDDTAFVRVVDQGLGMTAEELAQLGTPFFSRRRGGTGLGLVIARGVARQHGGDLSFQSAVGVGTTATLTLALAVEPSS